MGGASLSAAASSLAALLVILLLLGAAAFAARRLRARMSGTAAKTQAMISILAHKPLGGQHVLLIAEVDGARFLIGVSRGAMTMLGRLPAHD